VGYCPLFRQYQVLYSLGIGMSNSWYVSDPIWFYRKLQLQQRLRFRCLHGTAPSYLADSLRRTASVEGRRHLRSSITTSLVIPSTRRSTLGDRAFPVAATRMWNNLSASVRNAPFLLTFRRELKILLFRRSFNGN